MQGNLSPPPGPPPGVSRAPPPPRDRRSNSPSTRMERPVSVRSQFSASAKPDSSPYARIDADDTMRARNNENADMETGNSSPPRPVSTQSARERIKSEKRRPPYPVAEPSSPSSPKDDNMKESGREKGDLKKDNEKMRFSGTFPLQYAIMGHYMTYGSASLALFCGIFGVLWTYAKHYQCKLNGSDIYAGYIYETIDGINTCPTFYNDLKTGQPSYICCSRNDTTDLKGTLEIGLIYIAYSILISIQENASWGFGLYYPTDSVFYSCCISPLGMLHVIVGIVGLGSYSTCIGVKLLLKISIDEFSLFFY